MQVNMKIANNSLFNGKLYYFVLVLLPALVLAYTLLVRDASGPFWLGSNHDPDYAYLLNSLSISQGMKAVHADHPGSTLQLLECSLLYLINFVAGQGELVNDVLARPEFYLVVMHTVLAVLLFITLVIAGIVTFNWNNDIFGALLIQAGVLFTYTARLFVLPRMKPELLLLILSMWMALIVMYHKYVAETEGNREPFWQYGIVSGLGIGLKITFAPLLILPLFLLRRLKNQIAYVLVLLTVFFVLAANPLMNFRGFLRFLFGSLVARHGYNRPLVEGSSKLEAMGQGLDRLFDFSLQYEPVLLGVLVAFVAAGALVGLSRVFGKGATGDGFTVRLWSGLLTVVAFQFLLVANGPRANYHYTTPSLGLIGLLAFLSWNWPLTVLKDRAMAKNAYRVVYLSFVLVILVHLGNKLPAEIASARRNSGKWLEVHKFKEKNNLLNTPVIYYFRSSGIDYALDFGNALAGRRFSSQLKAIYHNSYMYNIWKKNLWSGFGSEMTTLDAILDRSGPVLIQGSFDYYPLIPGLAPDAYPPEGSTGGNFKRAALPVEDGNRSFVAEVLFRGKNEWLVLVK
jgi:hypothetical protein